MQGPTAVLKIRNYSLVRDVQASLQRPRMPPSAFLHPPLVVMSGFSTKQHLKLTAVLFQNMFPAINVNTAKLSQCQVCNH
jgi:ribosome biogenesis protein SSF1/2